jgi:hypothetical protein
LKDNIEGHKSKKHGFEEKIKGKKKRISQDKDDYHAE